MVREHIAGIRHLVILARLLVLRALPPALLLALLLPSCRNGPDGQASPEEQELRRNINAFERREQILAMELALAKSQAPYLTVDVATRRIDLKIQGHTLRSFSIDKISRNGGAPFTVQTWSELEVKPLEVPARSQVVPGSGEATTASVATQDPWGPKRMPADYDVICKGSQALEIRSLPSGQSRSRIGRWLVSSYRQTRDWMRDFWSRGKSGYRQSLEIWVVEDNAKLLFWSLPRQFNVLLINVP